MLPEAPQQRTCTVSLRPNSSRPHYSHTTMATSVFGAWPGRRIFRVGLLARPEANTGNDLSGPSRSRRPRVSGPNGNFARGAGSCASVTEDTAPDRIAIRRDRQRRLDLRVRRTLGERLHEVSYLLGRRDCVGTGPQTISVWKISDLSLFQGDFPSAASISTPSRWRGMRHISHSD